MTSQIRTLVVLVAAAAIVLPAVAAAGTPLQRRSPPGHPYSVLLPAGWRFEDATYPSDHSTHLWWLPVNALQKAEVVLSGCIGCITRHDDGRTPYPQGLLPANVISTRRLGPWKIAYVAYAADDPYPDDGVVVVTRHGGRISGSVRLDLWLPPSQHGLATRILNSLRIRP